MTRPGRTALLLLLGSTGLVMAVAAVLAFSVPSFKRGLKELGHAWSCPDVPEKRSRTGARNDGTPIYEDPISLCAYFPIHQPTLFYDFECPLNTFFTPNDSAYSGQGVLGGPWLSYAVQRRVGDISDDLISISAGFMLKCSTMEPDLRIVIRIDHSDGTLLEWNQKRLIAGEHRPNEWERFNFEWILHDLALTPDDIISVFFTDHDEGVMIDDLTVVFRSRSPVQPATPHA